ncbi:hypothetical protein ABZZ37_19105 [Streptomyces sp. NPDC006464]|uniref:DUF3817 domain-containing protein n=1 Tax=unclassified Streptomyces TaxID=2593676 RepID=UPI00339E42BF
MRILRIAAAVEAVSLALLLLNLVTVHAEVVTSLGGPVHGTAYLTVILVVRLNPSPASAGARWRALVPGVGGLLVLRRPSEGVVAGEG